MTKSKIETFPKIVIALSGILVVVSTIKLTRIEVDIDNVDVFKTKELIGIDPVNAEVEKIVELTETLTDDVGTEGASLVAEEVTSKSVDKVLDTSIAPGARRW